MVEIPGIDRDEDCAAVGLPVAPDCLALALSTCAQIVVETLAILGERKIGYRHVREFVTCVPVMSNCGVVDGCKPEGFEIHQPHRHGIAVEQQPEGLLALFYL